MKKLLRTLDLIAAAQRQQVRSEVAYIGNFWFDVLSKIVYNLTAILFFDQLFKRIGSFAGYSYNDFLCMYLISQIGFYICMYVLHNSMQNLSRMVNTGNFDLLLLKPVPHQLFLYASTFRPIEVTLTCVPMLIVVGALIDFSALSVTPLSVFLASLVLLSGIIICRTVLIVLVLPAFRTGESTDSLNVFYSISHISQMPYDKLPAIMKFASVVVLPQLVVSAATAQVLLGRHDVSATLTLVFIAAGVSLILAHVLWRYAMRQYTSASS